MIKYGLQYGVEYKPLRNALRKHLIGIANLHCGGSWGKHVPGSRQLPIKINHKRCAPLSPIVYLVVNSRVYTLVSC